jgi:hypothetical protein
MNMSYSSVSTRRPETVAAWRNKYLPIKSKETNKETHTHTHTHNKQTNIQTNTHAKEPAVRNYSLNKYREHVVKINHCYVDLFGPCMLVRLMKHKKYLSRIR